MNLQISTMGPTQRLIAAVVLIIIAGAVGFLLGRSAERRQASVQPVAQGAAAVAGAVLLGNAISVDDQAPGMRVMLRSVSLAKDGWAVIHEDRDGKPGNILGAQLFLAGANQSGSVDLLRATEEGKVYYAMLHSDDGDRTFDHQKDLPLKDSGGNIIFQRFLTTTQPPGE